MTTGPTDVKVTTAAGGPDGMPLALKLNEGLGPPARDSTTLSTLRGMARGHTIARCQWCGDYTRKPCQCSAEVEIDRLRVALMVIEDSEGWCASFVRPYTCWTAGRKVLTGPDMERADAVCSHCIAARALRDADWRA